jgi:hypothetical protein
VRRGAPHHRGTQAPDPDAAVAWARVEGALLAVGLDAGGVVA